MRRFLSVVLFSAALAAWVGAQPGVRPTPANQMKMIQRNRNLYHVALDRGLNMSKQYDPLERAGTCTELAKDWAKEVSKAVDSGDKDRVSEIGKQLAKVVDQGVVPNLEQARKQIKAGSIFEDALFKRRDAAVDVLKPLEDKLNKVQEYDAVRKAVAEGLSRVQNAAKAAK